MGIFFVWKSHFFRTDYKRLWKWKRTVTTFLLSMLNIRKANMQWTQYLISSVQTSRQQGRHFAVVPWPVALDALLISETTEAVIYRALFLWRLGALFINVKEITKLYLYIGKRKKEKKNHQPFLFASFRSTHSASHNMPQVLYTYCTHAQGLSLTCHFTPHVFITCK